MRVSIRCTAIILSFSSLCLAQLNVEIDPGVGRFGDQNFLDVMKEGNSYRVLAHVEPGGSYAPTFDISWSRNVWSLLAVTRGSGIARFSPFGNFGGIGSRSPLVLPPHEEFSQYGLYWGSFIDGGCVPNCPDSDEDLELSLFEIEPPLLGD